MYRVSRRAPCSKNCIIESIRTTGEAVLLQKYGAKLISVDANIDLRYDRAILRGSETDKVSKEKFQADEEREWAYFHRDAARRWHAYSPAHCAAIARALEERLPRATSSQLPILPSAHPRFSGCH